MCIEKKYFYFIGKRVRLSPYKIYDGQEKGKYRMKIYFAEAVECFVEDMLEANADNLKAFETKPGVYANVDPETHHEVEIPDVHLTK